jgi:hypothetical protein
MADRRDGTVKTVEFHEEARKEVDKKQDSDRLKPSAPVASDEVNTDEPEKKDIDGYEHHADNNGNFNLEPLDDGTNVEEGHVMENQAREPAHQQHELAVEEDAPGYEQAAALMLPRGNEHYNEGGSQAEVNAGKSFGEA